MPFVISTSHGLAPTVNAGTVIQIFAYADPTSVFNDQAQASTFDFHWRIVGPFDLATVDQTGTDVLFWDTTGLQAGNYTVYSEATPKSGTAGAGGGATTSVPVTSVLAGPFGGGPPLAATPSGPLGPGDGTPVDIKLTAAVPTIGSEGVLPVSLQRTALAPTVDQVLWVIIRNRTNAVGFRHYREFADAVMCGEPEALARAGMTRPPAYYGSDAYVLLKKATELFLMQEAGVLYEGDALVPAHELALRDIEQQFADADAGLALGLEERRRLGHTTSAPEIRRLRDAYYEELRNENLDVLPYLRIIRERLAEIPLKPGAEVSPACYGILRSRLAGPPLLELIWSYWHEEGMLVQTLNAILARFQNRALAPGTDPLARFDLDPLRPLSNLFWGWVQDEVHRLTVRRRAFEYDHEYGLQLIGKAVPTTSPVDRRSKFLEAFHGLLNRCHVFFKEDDDTTVIADGFPVLNALRETHLLLAEGAHNQFGDLPWTARAEMLVMEWLLSRPEMREFLGGRVMVPYEEPWMDRVDSMKSLQGWTDITVTHFRDLGVFGEQIVLSIRYGNWSVINDPQQAANWARYWRPEIQRYAHAYRAATGVDLSERVVAEGVDATMPSLHLQRRLAGQRKASGL